MVTEDGVGLSFIGVEGQVFTNLRSYGDLIGLGSVDSGVSSARNIRFRRSLLQYWSSGVERHDSSSLFIRVAGSIQTVC